MGKKRAISVSPEKLRTQQEPMPIPVLNNTEIEKNMRVEGGGGGTTRMHNCSMKRMENLWMVA